MSGPSPSFDQLSINLSDTPILYGSFLTALISFLLVAFVLFLVVKAANRLRRPSVEQQAPATRDCPFCFTAIQAAATRCSACTSEIVPTEGPSTA